MLFLFWSGMWLSAGRQCPLLAIQKVQQPDNFWVTSTVQPCKLLLFPYTRRWQTLDFTEQHDWHLGYRQEHIQLWRAAQGLMAGPEHGEDGADRLLGSTCYLSIYAPGWRSVSVEPVRIHARPPCLLSWHSALSSGAERDSLIWYTDALSELKSWQNLLIIFARAPQGRQAMLSRCVSHFLAY